MNSKNDRLRTIKFCVIYDPLTKTICSEIYRYKYQVPQPSKASGLKVVHCKGFYVPRHRVKKMAEHASG